MKNFILLLLFSIAMTTSAFSEGKHVILKTHQTGCYEDLIKNDRSPISLPIVAYYDSDTNILEVWCDDDNIQAEVFSYDKTGALEAYSPYMNVTLMLPLSDFHSIIIKGDGWEAKGELIKEWVNIVLTQLSDLGLSLSAPLLSPGRAKQVRPPKDRVLRAMGLRI